MNYRHIHSIALLKHCILVSICCISLCVLGQGRQREQEKINMLKERHIALKNQRLSMQLDTAIELSKQGVYTDADEIFVGLLDEMDRIPSDMVYYFGKNSFYLNKYAQSIDWLSKYMELKGATGKFSKSASKYLKKAENQMLEEVPTTHLDNTPISALSWEYKIPCKPIDKIVCPVCNGATVLISYTPLQEIYRACPYCSNLGYVSCEAYNEIIKGTSK